MSHITILGAGMAGLSAAQHAKQLGSTVTVYEKEKEIGGHTRTHAFSGYLFDEGPHFSFTKSPDIQSLFKNAVKNDYVECPLVVKNYWRNHWLSHPVQCHLYGLPPNIIERCINDFKEKERYQTTSPLNYEQWCYQQFGKSISELFIFKYTQKYWTVPAKTLSTNWTTPRIYVPTLKQIIDGAKKNHSNNFHYIQTIRYPRKGGFQHYTHFFQQKELVALSHKLSKIDPINKILQFDNGHRGSYQKLISTLPLPLVINYIKNVPASIQMAAKQLKYTSVALCCLGFKSEIDFPPGHLHYFYDDDIIFSRAYYPHRLSPFTVPKGRSSIQCEIYHSPEIKPTRANILNRTIENLINIGMLKDTSQIDVAQVLFVPFANIIMTPDRQQHVQAIHDYLKQYDIVCAGRYGKWDYYWTDDSIISGQQAVQHILDAPT
jgi:protoporphyrinogen oxidase